METIPVLPILLLSVVFHEVAHGWMALRLGDPTARDAGRLTFNPIPHIDLVGSIIIPLFSLVTAGRIFIAWAKPVPINPGYFSDLRRGEVYVSVIGPLSNLLMALFCSIAVILTAYAGRSIATTNAGTLAAVWKFFMQMFLGGIYLNIGLAIFNLIPIPPLDGSHVLAAFLPREAAARYQGLGFFGVFFVIVLFRLPAFNAAFSAVAQAVLTPYRSLIALFIPELG